MANANPMNSASKVFGAGTVRAGKFNGQILDAIRATSMRSASLSHLRSWRTEPQKAIFRALEYIKGKM